MAIIWSKIGAYGSRGWKSSGPFFDCNITLPRKLEAAELAAHLTAVGAKATACQSIEEGVRTAISLAGSDGVVLCFGSLYTIGSIKEALDEQ